MVYGVSCFVGHVVVVVVCARVCGFITYNLLFLGDGLWCGLVVSWLSEANRHKTQNTTKCRVNPPCPESTDDRPAYQTLQQKCRRDAQRLALQCSSAMSLCNAMHSTGGGLLRDVVKLNIF